MTRGWTIESMVEAKEDEAQVVPPVNFGLEWLQHGVQRAESSIGCRLKVPLIEKEWGVAY